MKRGISMVEVMVAVVVIALAVGPLITLLSSSNRMSNASIYEVMASHYAAELGEQLQRLGPLLNSLKGKTAKDLDELLEGAVNNHLMPGGCSPTEPTMVNIPGTYLSLFVSPLDPAFTGRKLSVKPITPPSGLTILNDASGQYWNITISLSWKLQPSDTKTIGATYSLILREDL